MNKIVESTNVRVDESSKKNKEDSKREPIDYKKFEYISLSDTVERVSLEVEPVQ